MSAKTKTMIQDRAYEVYTTKLSAPDTGPSGSRLERIVYKRDGKVLYAPYKNPDFKRRIAEGRDATSVLIGDGYKLVSKTPFRARVLNGYPGNKVSSTTSTGDLFAVVTANHPRGAPETLTKAQALAAEKFLSKYYEKTRALRGASTLAELGSTIRGLVSPAKALRKEVGNLNASLRKKLWRSDRVATRDMASVLGGTWLEWVFGIKPLVEDVNGAADAVNRMSEGNFKTRVYIKAQGMDEASRLYATNQGVIVGNPGLNTSVGTVDISAVDRTFCIIRGVVDVAPQGEEVPPIQQFGVGFEDILPGVWEGIPWSFFIDYFTNVSSVIDAWSFVSSRLRWCNRTIRNSRVVTLSDLRPLPWSRYGQYWSESYASGGHAEAEYTSVIRSPVNWQDVAPSLRLRVPGVGSPKWANLAALATMAVGPKGEPPVWVGRSRRRFR